MYHGRTPRTLGRHIVKSGYGLWLPGDRRGHWSSAWDDQIGYTEPHTLHAGDPIRQRMAEERMQHPPVRFTPDMIDAIVTTVGRCAETSDWRVAAMTIESTHMHLLMTYTPRDIDRTCKWLAQQTTRFVHERTPHVGPVWARGKWCTYVFDDGQWANTRQYIERHNTRHGLPPRPYGFIT